MVVPIPMVGVMTMFGFETIDIRASFAGLTGYAKYVARRRNHELPARSGGCRWVDEYLYNAGRRWFVRRMDVARSWSTKTLHTDAISTTIQEKEDSATRRYACDFLVEMAKSRLDEVARWRGKCHVDPFLRALARLRKHFPREAARLRRTAVYALRKQGRTIDFCAVN